MKYLLTFITLLFFISVNAQRIEYIDPDAHLSAEEREDKRLKGQKHTLKWIGASFRMYPGFHQLKKIPPMHCGMSGIDYLLGNRDSTVLIALTLDPRDSAMYKRDTIWTRMMKGYTPDDQWLLHFRANVDSSSFKPVLYSQKELKKYNADAGGELKKNCKHFYLEKYLVRRSIILNKKYRGIILIHYFTKENDNRDISRYIKNSSKMIHYN